MFKAIDPAKATSGPLKEVLAILLEPFTPKELNMYVSRGFVPNVKAFVKLLEPPMLQKIIVTRLKTDYQKYIDKMTIEEYCKVIQQYKPDLWPILSQDAKGQAWLKRSFKMIIDYFESL